MATTLAAMRILPLLLVFFVGCATTERHADSTPSAPSFSTPSASFQTSYVSRGSTFVERVHVNADLVVRPDRVCVPVQIHAVAADPAGAMKLAEDAAAALRTSSQAALRVDDIDARSDRVGAGDEARIESSVTMKGVVEIELADAAEDPWARAKRVAALHRAVVEKATPPEEWSKITGARKPGEAAVHVGVGNPEPGVRDVEQHRPKLLASWSERARALATAATFDGATLELLGCVPPAQVQVVGGTLEKVGLSLPVQCTFQVRKAP